MPSEATGRAPHMSGLSAQDYRDRLRRAAADAAAESTDALLVSPGPDLQYLTGYGAVALERLTCLVIPAVGRAFLAVPELELHAARSAGVEALDIDLVGWTETQDPYALVAQRLGDAKVVAVDNHMWAEKVFALAAALPGATQRLAGTVLTPLRMTKSAAEIAELQTAAAAIDAVHAAMPQWLRVGRTEREVADDIAAAIIDVGHRTVDFVIVGSGPNGASPHHEVSDRVIAAGDPVVVDIGGTTAAGYCSDSTRTYSMGEPPADFRAYYEVLQAAQAAAVAAVRPGVACEDIDRAARDLIAAAGFGEMFMHRTGHGIGTETHEEPYIVAGNTTPLEAGMAFSVEPGIYVAGRHGARIEDIVVCTDDGVMPLNRRPHDLQVIE